MNHFLSLAAAIALLLPQPNTPMKKGPASDEIQALVRADQAVRQFIGTPTREELQRMERGDFAREERVRQLLRQDKVVTMEDFDACALIMQHGSDPDDYETARELAIISCFKGGYHSLPALAEDRFLLAIGRKQRFGGQFSWGKNGSAPVFRELDESPPAAVTDSLRLDFLQPPLALIREKGMEAFKSLGDLITRRIVRSRDEKQLASLAKAPPTMELASLYRTFSARDVHPIAVARVLELYRADKILTAEAAFHASGVLATSSEAQVVLLANELAALAVNRRYARAKKLFAKTWDKFLVIVGRPDRYGTISGAAKVSIPVAREFLG